jgi:Lrp/AsnC family transcriptional regulator, leucine-responsive regulatory protein
MTSLELDTLDKAILKALSEDGRQSQVQLAERIPLSPTAIARRIKTLEDTGVIDGFEARISLAALGLSMRIVLHITLRSQSVDLLEEFEKALKACPSVLSCHLVSGEDDYIVIVQARDLADFELIHKTQLSRLPGVARLKSSFALREVVDRALPLSALQY